MTPLDERVTVGLQKLGLALKHRTWTLANEVGLSPTQGQIVSVLAGEGALSTSEVAARIGVSLPTISDAVSALVRKRLVRRSPDPRHPRARLLHLTAGGAAHAARARTWPDFLASAVGTLSRTEQTVMLTALFKMIRTLQEAGQIPTSRMCATCVHFRPRVREGPHPHHCGLVDAPMADGDLRIDCREHEAASASDQQSAWMRFVHAE